MGESSNGLLTLVSIFSPFYPSASEKVAELKKK